MLIFGWSATVGDTLPIDLNAAALGIGRHVSGIADPFKWPYRRVPHSARPALGRLNRDHLESMSDPGVFAVGGPEEQEGGEPPPLRRRGQVVVLASSGCTRDAHHRARVL